MSRPRKPSRRSRRGFALIDVIVGGVMIGIGVVAMITITSRALTSQTEGEQILVASWLADELLNMVLVEGPDEYPKIHDTIGRFEEPFANFEYEVDIQDQGPREPFRVTAYIRWPKMRGMREIAVETLIAIRLGEELIPRMPIDILDRESRYFDDEP